MVFFDLSIINFSLELLRFSMRKRAMIVSLECSVNYISIFQQKLLRGIKFNSASNHTCARCFSDFLFLANNFQFVLDCEWDDHEEVEKLFESWKIALFCAKSEIHILTLVQTLSSKHPYLNQFPSLDELMKIVTSQVQNNFLNISSNIWQA